MAGANWAILPSCMHFISFPFRLSIKGAGLLDWCFQSWQPAAAGEAILEKLKALEEKKIQLMKRLQQEQIDDLTSRLSHTEGREAVQAEQIEELQDAGFSPSETID